MDECKYCFLLCSNGRWYWEECSWRINLAQARELMELFSPWCCEMAIHTKAEMKQYKKALKKKYSKKIYGELMGNPVYRIPIWVRRMIRWIQNKIKK